MAVWRNPADLGFDEAWEILNAEPSELSAERRRLRVNLVRRWRERRRPFTQPAVDAFVNRLVERIRHDMGVRQ